MAAQSAPKKQRSNNQQQQGDWRERNKEYRAATDPSSSRVVLAEDESRQTRAKVGLFGRQGSGKTVLACLMGIATSKAFCPKCTEVAVYDTEGGTDFMLPAFKAEGLKRLIVRSRSLADLVAMARQAEQRDTVGVLIVDQITHPWNELMAALRKKLNVNKLAFHHFNEIKDNWKAWPDFYVNSRLHIFVAGRLGFDWQEREDEQGNVESVRAGTKMKTEVDFGHEPNLLLELEAFEATPGVRGDHAATRMTHRVWVKKDRAWLLNGKHFDFEDMDKYEKGYAAKMLAPFLPHYKALNIGGSQAVFDESRNDQHLYDARGRGQYQRALQARAVALEDIQATLLKLWPGRDDKSKLMKVTVIEGVFGVRSWKAVEDKPVMDVEVGMRVLRQLETAAKQTHLDLGNEAHVLDAIKDAKQWELENRPEFITDEDIQPQPVFEEADEAGTPFEPEAEETESR